MAVHFGVSLPQIKRSWDETRAAAQEFEALGYDSVWLNDHLYGIPGPQIPILEAWTTLSAVGAITSRVQLGTLVSPIGFRNPALLAKMAATLDNITDGRLIVGLGGGWFEMEFSGYGFDFPPLAVRLRQLDEAATLMMRMWTEEQPSFTGQQFHTASVYCEPKPVRKPHPPILIGGGGEKILLRIAAKHADIWNNLAVHQGQLAHKVALLRHHCEAVGRDPQAIQISQQTMVVIGKDAADAQAKVEKAQAIYGGHLGQGIAGTPSQCIDKIQQHIAAGCTMFVIEFFGRDTREPARLFAETVLPRFKQ
ncbi:MAG TPA: TIGR03560 family F420-dependent LLM class oxidoreductase [Candidatus Margulisiibacteriota bacterium]|nr:TIGR03560 family F420-dependent LLM class oxidoreductase [Candidatus Margulisiibacteriota bacterium]